MGSQGGHVSDPTQFLERNGVFNQERAPTSDILKYLLLRAIDWSDPKNPQWKVDASFGGTIIAKQEVSNVLANGKNGSLSNSTLVTLTSISPIVDTCVSKIVGSGSVYGKFELFVNAISTNIVQRGGVTRNITLDFNSPFKVAAGDTLEVKVEHFQSGVSASFEAAIMGRPL